MSSPTACVLDGEIVIAGPTGLDFDALVPAHPSRGHTDQPARRDHSGFFRRLRPPRPRRHLSWRALRPAPQGAGKLLKKAKPPIHLTPATQDPDVASRLVLPLRRRRARRRRRQAGRPPLPARQAGHDQGEARAHRRLRRSRLPHPQGRRGRRLPPPRALRRRRHAPPRRRRVGFSVARRREFVDELAPYRKNAPGSPLGGLGRGAGRSRAPGARTAGTPART